MPETIADSWLTLDRDITAIASLLQVYFNIPAIKPMNPRAFGFHNFFRHQWMVASVVKKSRDWFSVWVSLLSFLIARAEYLESELRMYPHLAKRNWRDYLLEKGVEMTWLDSLVSSVACSFHPDTTRTGIFLRLPAEDTFQPSVEWFCQYGVPVWYAWGQEQAQDQRFSSLAPLTHQLQTGTTTLLQNPSSHETLATDKSAPATQKPSPHESVATDRSAPVAQNPSPPDYESVYTDGIAPAIRNPTSREPAATDIISLAASARSVAPPITSAPIPRETHLPSWKEFFASREAMNRHLETTETATDKQKRLSRERKPPTHSAKVFCWVKDLTSDQYVREQVSKKWRQDTLGNYSSKQTRYDSFSNEWDCSSQFGPDDDSDDEDSVASEELFVDYNEVSDMHMDTGTPVFLTSSHMNLASIEHEQEWLPFSATPQSVQGQAQQADAIIEEELLEAAYIYFGYTGPLPLPSLPLITDPSRQKAFLRFFGFSWAQSCASLFSRPQILALSDFIYRMSSNGILSNDDWDLSRENRLSTAFMGRFKCIQEVSGPNGPLFMLSLGASATVKWILTLTTAADALLVCRLHPKLQEKDLALYLLRRGIPFHTLQDANTLHAVQHDKQRYSKHPYRPVNHQFTIRDYAAYLEQCEVICAKRRARAALLRGGYLWRVSVASISFDTVLNGPSGRATSQDEMFIVTLPNGVQLVDDALLESEILLLSGMYNCATGMLYIFSIIVGSSNQI